MPDDFKQRLIKLNDGSYVMGTKCNMGGYEASEAAGWVDPDDIQSEDAGNDEPDHVCACGSVGWKGNCDQCIPW